MRALLPTVVALLIAAAVATFFATVLMEQGVEGGRELRALVFLVIVVSAFNCISAAAAAIFAPWVATRIFGVVSLILFLGVIYLCLRREPDSLSRSFETGVAK